MHYNDIDKAAEIKLRIQVLEAQRDAITQQIGHLDQDLAALGVTFGNAAIKAVG